MNFLVAVQATSQLDTVYGNNYAKELRDTFPAALIMFAPGQFAANLPVCSWVKIAAGDASLQLTSTPLISPRSHRKIHAFDNGKALSAAASVIKRSGNMERTACFDC